MIDNQIDEIETQAKTMIAKLKLQKQDTKERFYGVERQLLQKVEQNPKIWNQNNIKFQTKKTKASFVAPNIEVDVSLNFCEHRVSGPINPVNWVIVGKKIRCFPNFEVSFECKKQTSGNLGYCRIGNWFGLGICSNSKKAGTYEIRLKQVNGLFNESKQYATDSKNHNLNNRHWNKGFVV